MCSWLTRMPILPSDAVFFIAPISNLGGYQIRRSTVGGASPPARSPAECRGPRGGRHAPPGRSPREGARPHAAEAVQKHLGDALQQERHTDGESPDQDGSRAEGGA